MDAAIMLLLFSMMRNQQGHAPAYGPPIPLEKDGRSDEEKRMLVAELANSAFAEQPTGWFHPDPLPLSHFIEHFRRELGIA